jgi:hypothetical protein
MTSKVGHTHLHPSMGAPLASSRGTGSTGIGARERRNIRLGGGERGRAHNLSDGVRPAQA